MNKMNNITIYYDYCELIVKKIGSYDFKMRRVFLTPSSVQRAIQQQQLHCTHTHAQERMADTGLQHYDTEA